MWHNIFHRPLTLHPLCRRVIWKVWSVKHCIFMPPTSVKTSRPTLQSIHPVLEHTFLIILSIRQIHFWRLLWLWCLVLNSMRAVRTAISWVVFEVGFNQKWHSIRSGLYGKITFWMFFKYEKTCAYLCASALSCNSLLFYSAYVVSRWALGYCWIMAEKTAKGSNNTPVPEYTTCVWWFEFYVQSVVVHQFQQSTLYFLFYPPSALCLSWKLFSLFPIS